MQLDVPQELPRERTEEVPRSTSPLEPSPLEKRREDLIAQANDHRSLPIPIVLHKPVADLGRIREPKQRSLSADHPGQARPTDHRMRRQAIPQQVVGLSLRDEERKILAEVGRFRVISTRDLAETVYGNRHSRMRRDLAFLREKRLIQVDAVNARRDGRVEKVGQIEVITLTRAGRDVARQTSDLPQDQKLYSGMVKPREVEHDTQIYRAYCKEAARIEQKGGTNLRIRLDFEMKSQIQKAIYAERKVDPSRDMAEIKHQVARQFDLPYVNDGIQIPDARIEYDLPQGAGTGHEDIEVLTAAYRPGHLRNKAQAGFHVYASSRDRATLTAKIEDDHGLMESILEL